MNALATTWPWSLPPGPAFLLAWIPLALLLVGCGVLVAIIVGNAWDGPIQRVSTSTAAATTAAAGSSLAAVPSTSGGPLLVGRMPRPDDVWLVAWLRGGKDALRTTLFTAARTAGWLQLTGEQPSLLVDVVPGDPALTSLHHALGSRPLLDLKALLQGLDDTAADLERSVARRAEEAGLVRPLDRRLGLLLLGLGGALVAVVAGIVRIVIRAELNPDAVFPRNLVVAMMVTVGLAALLTWRTTGQHRQARAYLSWLDDVTVNLRKAVERGGVRRPADVVLVSALGGHGALGVTGAALGLAVLVPQHAAASGGGSSSSCSSSSSSSCSSSSSSSCGSSGGSSCGSSCGGGGGCS